MKRDDIAMGHAASELALGSPLSEAEQVLCGEPDQFTGRERTEAFLYHQLRIARDARQRMERLPAWGLDYVHEHRQREEALAAAQAHLTTLRAEGDIDATLARMLQAEGIEP